MPLDHLTPNMIDIYHAAGYDGRGQRVFGSHQRVRVRFESADEMIRNALDQMIRISGRIFVPAGIAISDNDRVIRDHVNYLVARTERFKMITGAENHVEAALTEE